MEAATAFAKSLKDNPTKQATDTHEVATVSPSKSVELRMKNLEHFVTFNNYMMMEFCLTRSYQSSKMTF